LTRFIFCKKCNARGIRVRGETYNTLAKEHENCRIGLYCMKCKTLELDPNVPISDIIFTEALQIHA